MRKNITAIGVVIGVAIAVLLTGYGIKKVIILRVSELFMNKRRI